MELFIFILGTMTAFKWVYLVSFAMSMFYRVYYSEGIRFMFEDTHLGGEGGLFAWTLVGMIPVLNTALSSYTTYILYVRKDDTDT